LLFSGCSTGESTIFLSSTAFFSFFSPFLLAAAAAKAFAFASS